MLLIGFNVSLELSSLIIVGAALLCFLAVLLVKLFSRGRIIIEGVDCGLGGASFRICEDKSVRQVAYKIWVEINTRTIGVQIELEKDIIRAIHTSFYEFFKTTRTLIEDIPASHIKKNKELIDLSMSFLNDVMRPYLTKWGLKFNDWYDREQEKNNTKSPQELQKRYKEYDELTKDLLALNSNTIGYSNSLKRIAFKEKNKKQ